ncbi:GFA family protein [Pararhizobium arenae]|uniref:GFA family protein n=1 Tax=Pararhizobium arenae TaxID=1856850 RepID=UPI00094B3C44|nr:GFA family protein [Pararhizobium arenae]
MSSKPDLPSEGGCRCGRVRLKISKAPIMTMACHCTGCQRMSSSAYSLSALMPTDGFEITQGEPVIGGLQGETRHYFCDYCLSWMFTRPAGMDWLVNMRPTMLDDASWCAPFIETFTSEKLAFAETGARHSYKTFPPMEAYEGLIAEYQALAQSSSNN